MNVRDVKEPIFVFVFFIDATHKSSCWWQNLVHEDEDGLLRRKLDALADHVNELADGEICRYKVLLLVDGCNVRLFNFLTDHLVIRDEVSTSNKR